MECKDLQKRLLAYLYEELPSEERTVCDAHLAQCTRCQSELESTRRLHHLLSERSAEEPSPALLVECREALSSALDREPAPGSLLARLRAWVSPLRPMPAFSAAGALTLLLFGFGLGWELRARARPAQPGSSNIAASSFGLENFRINGISRVAPDPQTGEVRITLDAERRVTLQGSLDDPRIQQVLVYAVKSYDNAGIRRDTLDALRPRASNPNFRQALLYAMRQDRNPGVRLEALDAVRGLEWDADTRRAFLDLLEHDANPGLRIAAIDELVKHADQEVLAALGQLAAKDSSRFVRLKCATAVRDIDAK